MAARRGVPQRIAATVVFFLQHFRQKPIDLAISSIAAGLRVVDKRVCYGHLSRAAAGHERRFALRIAQRDQIRRRGRCGVRQKQQAHLRVPLQRCKMQAAPPPRVSSQQIHAWRVAQQSDALAVAIGRSSVQRGAPHSIKMWGK